MEHLDLAELTVFSPAGPVKKELAVTENFKIMLLCFDAGKAVPPCVMERHTAFYLVEGKGTVSAEGEAERVSPGALVFIAPGKERQIRAETRLVVLAVQYAESTSW